MGYARLHHPTLSVPAKMKFLIAFFCAVLATSAYALDSIKCAEGTTLTGDAPPDGTQQQCALPDGTPHGEQRVWYHDGKLMEQRHFDHGREHGEQKAWWPNGQLMMQGVSVQGKRYGGYKYWDIAGNPTKVEIATVPEKSLPQVDTNPVDKEPANHTLPAAQPATDKPQDKELQDQDDSEPLQDAIDQSQMKDVAPLPSTSIP